MFIDNFEEINLPFHGVRCPKIEFTSAQKKKLGLKDDATNLEFLQSLCQTGFKELKPKFDQNRLEEYKQRAMLEIKTLDDLGFIDYILIVWDVIRFCREEKIPTANGRGSCSGSLVLYLINVTRIDPIKYGLYFERFISATRAKKNIVDGITYFDGGFLPDVDLDIEYYRRHEVIKYLESRYPNRTAKILNTNTLSGKVLIKDCGKVVADKKEEEMNYVTSLIESKHGKVNEIEDEYALNEDFKKWCDENKDVYNIALQIKDLFRNKSVHASGNLVTFDEINNICPTELTKEGERVSSFNMEAASEVSLKLDLLGLKSLSVVDETCKYLGIKAEDIDTDDYDSIYSHLQDFKHPHGIFQLEAGTNFGVTQKVKPKNIEQLSAVLALARPGALAFVDQYAKFANEGIVKEIHPDIDRILIKTGGVCIYQETMMQIGHQVFGLTLAEADVARKIIAKKLIDKMAEWKDIIYNKAKEKNLSKEIADLYWKILDDSKFYSFNFSHGISYATLSATTIYLKFNYPKEFFTALLNMAKNESDFTEQLGIISQELRALNIPLLPPSLLYSDADFKIENDGIRYGLGAIKGVSDKVLKSLVKFRSEFKNKLECFDAAKEAGINIGVLSALIQAGALSDFGESRSRVVLEAQTYNILSEREKVLIHKLFDEGQTDILNCIKILTETLTESGKSNLIKPSRFETIKRKYNPYKQIYKLNSRNEDLANYWYEYSLLGNAYSQSLHKIYKEKNPRFTDLFDLKDKKDGEKVMIVGVVQEVSKKTSAKGNSYLKLNISDETATLSTLLFDGQRANIERVQEMNGGNLPEIKDIVIISGRTKGNAVFIDEVGIQTAKIYIKLSELKSDKVEIES